MNSRELAIELKAKDQMSQVLDHIAGKFGLLNKQGLAMGAAFASVNLAVNGLSQALAGAVQYAQQGIDMNRQMELSYARLEASAKGFNLSQQDIRQSLESFSVLFLQDMNTSIEGFQRFTQEGYNATEAMRLLYESGRLAFVKNTSLEASQQAVNTALQVFNLNAGQSSRVAETLNQILGTSLDMTMEDLNTILGSAAEKARTAGLTLDDFAGIVYTLGQHGDNTKTILSELKDILDKYPNGFTPIKIPTDAVKPLDEMYKRISGTVAITEEMRKKRQEFAQMNLTGDLDIFGRMDLAKEQAAAEFVEQLAGKGITTLAEFNKAFQVTWFKGYDAGGPAKAILDDISRWPDVVQRIREDLAYNEWFDSAFPTDQAETWQQALQRTNSAIQQSQTALLGYNQTLEQCKQDLSDLTELRQFTIDSHNATLAVQAQEDAVKTLQDAVDAYSLSQMRNNLEILKIQHGADRRHGLTREQRDQIENLQYSNEEIQIKEQEQQIAIAEIKLTGLHDAQDALDAIRRAHDEEMYEQEIRDLDKNIAGKNALYASTLTSIMQTNAAIATAQASFRNNELTRTIAWARNMHQWLIYAQDSDARAGTETLENPLASGFSNAWMQHISNMHNGVPSVMDRLLMAQGKAPVPGLDVGGWVEESGLAKVHRGEHYYPSGQQPAGNLTVTIGDVVLDVNADFRDGESVEDWSRKAGAGIAARVVETVNGALKTGVTSRKGGTVNVSGSQVTTRTNRCKNPDGTVATSTIIQAPATIKGRFRVG